MARMVHPSAVVADGAVLAEDVFVGPFCVVGAEVTLGAGVRLESHVCITGRTEIAARTRVYPFASLGHVPQDRKYAGEPSRLVIGEGCVIREHVTVNPGTRGGGMLTEIGPRCLLMAGAHVAHDCRLGEDVILVNQATLGGHVSIGDHAIVGGLAALHQFVRVGRHAMIGGLSGVEQDVIPFGAVQGNRACLTGLNLVGLRRHGFSRQAIRDLQEAYRRLFLPQATLQERLDEVMARWPDSAPVRELVDFVRGVSSRGLCQPGRDGAGA
ncbi:MAG: acyl-ACP--UDP-N-acetylglucosamine O-acyltransferase [Alphaproteobacteria bacterium]|nr:acyl-ACP--UDP-N-acetylglucosamine O-acyltransferase [Alphaproteobacteria bacterium]